MPTHRQAATALVALLALLALVPAASAAVADEHADSTQTNATTGQQLSTVIEVTDQEVRHEAELSALEAEFDADNESARAEAIAAHAAELRDRSDAVHADYLDATQAFEDGELTRSEYAQRLAVLHARANGILSGFDRVEAAAAETSSLELESAGYDASANDEARERLRSVSGTGVGALLAQFTGEARGEFSLETDGGLEVEVESEDGERSREYEREEPEHGVFEVGHDEARSSAEAELGSPGDNGSWVLQSIDRDDDGYYEFEFAYAGESTTGEAEVSVDARTGSVFALEEELESSGADEADDERDGEGADEDREREEDGDDERDEEEREGEERDEDDGDDDRDGLLAIEVVEGDLEPGATVTLQVTDVAGAAVSDAGVRVDYEEVGTTDDAGRIDVTVPQKDDVSFDVERGDAEGELEVAFADRDVDDEGDDRAANLDVSGQVRDGAATLVATYDGDPVSDAAVYVEDERVATTDSSGEAQFAAPEGDEFDATLVRGQLVAALELAVEGGDVTVLESELEDEFERETEADDDDGDHEDGSLDVVVANGDPAPGATVTIAVTDAAGAAVSDATVEVEGEVVGTTDADGEIAVTLPDSAEDAEIEAEHDHASGELDLEFGGDESGDSDEDGESESEDDDGEGSDD